MEFGGARSFLRSCAANQPWILINRWASFRAGGGKDHTALFPHRLGGELGGAGQKRSLTIDHDLVLAEVSAEYRVSNTGPKDACLT
jgi:hypothetical protein